MKSARWLEKILAPLGRNSSSKWVLAATILIFVLVHGRGLTSGPNGYHAWRETDTAMVAENFMRSGMDFFHPEVNLIGQDGGRVVGMELPVYNYAVAILYRVFGFSHVWPRLLSTLAGVAAIVAMALLAARVTRNRQASLLAAWLMAWSPLLYFYSHKIQPDVLGLALSLWGLVWFWSWREHGGYRAMFLSLGALAMAGGIKPTFLAVGLPMLWVLFTQDPARWRALGRPQIWFFGIGVLLPPSLWFWHARRLNDRFGEAYFYLGSDLWSELAGLLKPAFYQNVLLTWPIELAVGLPLFGALVYALVSPSVRARLSPWGGLIGAWLLGALMVCVLAAEHCATPHDYYFLVALPPLLLLATVGLLALLQHPQRRWVGALVLAMMPPYAMLRTSQRFGEAPDLEGVRGEVAAALRPETQGAPVTSVTSIMALTVDQVPGYLFYYTGLRGFQMLPDGDRQFFEEYRRRGAALVIIRPKVVKEAPWLQDILGVRLAGGQNWAVHRLR